MCRDPYIHGTSCGIDFQSEFRIPVYEKFIKFTTFNGYKYGYLLRI